MPNDCGIHASRSWYVRCAPGRMKAAEGVCCAGHQAQGTAEVPGDSETLRRHRRGGSFSLSLDTLALRLGLSGPIGRPAGDDDGGEQAQQQQADVDANQSQQEHPSHQTQVRACVSTVEMLRFAVTMWLLC